MINKWWLEFSYNQEMNYLSLFHFLGCVRRWLAFRPRIVRCAACGQGMWINGKEGPTYCGPDCAYYDGVPFPDEEELPF